MEIIFSEKNATGIIILNRPKALNALNIKMAKEFSDKIQEWDFNDNIKRVLLVGEGNHFCAGGDVKSLFLTKDQKTPKKEFFKS